MSDADGGFRLVSPTLKPLVLTQTEFVGLGLLYLIVFGHESVGGLMFISGLVGLAFAFSARHFAGINHG